MGKTINYRQPETVEYQGFVLYPCANSEYCVELDGKYLFAPVWELIEYIDVYIAKQNWTQEH